ncbi:MAG: hypothetical protein ACE37F_12015 [Nannocystaceae bacterium]|nr:hypothetical protein [bacterium]
MTRKLFAAGLLFTVLAAAPACKKDDMVKETMTEIDGLADEIVSTVKNADDKKQGVAEAQKLLDAKKEALGGQMDEVGQLRGFQVSEEVAAELTTNVAQSALEVESLKLNLMTETMKDKELDAALDKLTGDFATMVKP